MGPINRQIKASLLAVCLAGFAARVIVVSSCADGPESELLTAVGILKEHIAITELQIKKKKCFFMVTPELVCIKCKAFKKLFALEKLLSRMGFFLDG